MAPEGRPSGPLTDLTFRSLARGFLNGEMSFPLRMPLRGKAATGTGVTAYFNTKQDKLVSFKNITGS